MENSIFRLGVSLNSWGAGAPFLNIEGGQGRAPFLNSEGGRGRIRSGIGLKGGRGAGFRHHSLIPAISSSHTLLLLPPLTHTLLIQCHCGTKYLVALKVTHFIGKQSSN